MITNTTNKKNSSWWSQLVSSLLLLALTFSSNLSFAEAVCPCFNATDLSGTMFNTSSVRTKCKERNDRSDGTYFMTTAVIYTDVTSGDYVASYGVSAIMLSDTDAVDYFECSPEGDPILTEVEYTDCVMDMSSVESLGLSSTDCSVVVVAGGGEVVVTPTDAPDVPTETPPAPTDAPDVPTDEPPAPTDAPSGAFSSSFLVVSSLICSAAFVATVGALFS